MDPQVYPLVDSTASRHIWPAGWQGTTVSWATLRLRLAISIDQSVGTSERAFEWLRMSEQTRSVLAFWGFLGRGA